MNETVINGIIDDSSEMQGKLQYAVGMPGKNGEQGNPVWYIFSSQIVGTQIQYNSSCFGNYDANKTPNVGDILISSASIMYVVSAYSDGSCTLTLLRDLKAATDQTYSPTSENAQSGVAVAEAVLDKQDKFAAVYKSNSAETQLITDTPYLRVNALGVNIQSEVDMNSGSHRNKIVGLGDPENQYDAATKKYVDEHGGGGGGGITELKAAEAGSGTGYNIPIVDGVATIPAGTEGKAGLMRAMRPYGLVTYGDGQLGLLRSTPADIDGRVLLDIKPLSLGYIDYAVKAALTDSKRDLTYTSAQKDNACGVIGAAREKNFELIESVTLSEEIATFDRSTEPNGTAYNFKEFYIYVENTTTASSTPNIPLTVRSGDSVIVLANSIISLGIANNKCLIYLGIKNGIFDSWYTYDADRYNYGQPRRFNELFVPANNITRFILGGSSSRILSGTKISIYGVRA